MSTTQEQIRARAITDLLDEVRSLPAPLIQELAAYRGEPDTGLDDPATVSKLRGACLQLIDFAENIPDTLEAELYAYAEQLGVETIVLGEPAE